eukprot:jgi/Orpsp1_1/1176494/evm.model.c7180000057819.1
MGIKKISAYIKDNLKIQPKFWMINKEKYKKLCSMNYNDLHNVNNKFLHFQTETRFVNSEVLIVDGYSVFYTIGIESLTWLKFDEISSINIIKDIIFVFKGCDPEVTKSYISKSCGRIKYMKEFYDKIFLPENNKEKTISFRGLLSIYPITMITYIQFLCQLAEIIDNLEVKFTLYDINPYIIHLANKYNGYVISNNSEFYIYNVPGFINIDLMNFYINNQNMNIKYYFYTRKMLSNYLEISEELLNVIGVYCHRDINISKKITKYTNLNIYLNGSTLNDNNDFFRSLAYQLKYIYNINQVNVNDQDQKLKLEFEDYMKYCHQQIECKLENITSIDHGKLKDEIVQSFMTGKLYSELLSVILFNYFQLYQYFENIEENCCYNVTTHLRKSLYKLLLIRNYHDGYKTKNNDMCCSN